MKQLLLALTLLAYAGSTQAAYPYITQEPPQNFSINSAYTAYSNEQTTPTMPPTINTENKNCNKAYIRCKSLMLGLLLPGCAASFLAGRAFMSWYSCS